MADSSGTGRARGSRSQASPVSSRASPIRHGSTQRSNGASRNGSSIFVPNESPGGLEPAPVPSGSNLHSQASSFSLHEQFATSRREFEFDEDEEVLEPAPIIASSHEDALDDHEVDGEEATSDIGDETIRRLLHANEESFDYYTLLGLSREPPPTVAEIRAAYHRLSLAFHPDKHPHNLKASAQKYFTRLQKAYETLIEPRKRVIYDLEGEGGVQNEYKTGGAMGQGGEGERRIGVKTMGADEFREWFMGVLLERERRSIGELVGSTGTCKVVLNVEHLLSGSSRVGRFRPLEELDVEVEVSGPVVSTQELQFRQSFSVPLPGLGKLLLSRLPSWKEIIRGEVSINNDGEDEVARSSWEETVGPRIPKLTFSAGVSGPITETLLVRLPTDGHPEEDLPTSFCLYSLRSDKIHISTRLDHSFTDTRHQEATSSITSLMNGVDLDVTAGILPRRSLNIGLGRPFTLVEDTTPFYFHFRTLFNNYLNFKPPVLEFRISRFFGESHFGYCRWSSGDFGWPTLALISRISPIKFARRPLWLPQGLLMSNMRIGYFSIEDRSQMIQTDDEDDVNILDASDRYIEKPASSRVTSNKPSWHFTVDSSPDDTTVSVTWGRDLFSRAVEQPIRSRVRKSGEAVARSRDFEIPSPRGVRFEIEGNVGLDLSLGGVVRGVRRIGHFTSIGIGVGLNPERGLYISFSWSRLGQNIIVPVILLSGDELDFKPILWALAVPWATYAAVEFGILRPRLRRRRQKLIEKTRKELRETVLRRRVEAEQANVLMRPLVEHRQALEREQGGLVILRAEYGVRVIGSNSKSSWRPGEVADVTVALAALVDGGQLSLPRGLEKGSMIGFWDPAPLRKKLLIVDYLFEGKRHHAEFTHNDALSLPMRAHEFE